MPKKPPSSPEASAATRRLLHEVRTPIGQILGYAEMVEEAVTELGQPDLAADLTRIREAARKLLSYLEGVFLADGRATSVEEEEPPASGTLGLGAPTAGAGGSLLVVDDESGLRDILARRLTQAGYAVSQASNGRDALHVLESGAFDLVLLDVEMPDARTEPHQEPLPRRACWTRSASDEIGATSTHRTRRQGFPAHGLGARGAFASSEGEGSCGAHQRGSCRRAGLCTAQ